MNKKQVLKIIEAAAIDGRAKLDLSGKKLTEIPAEIGKLKNLTELYLGHNQLMAIPAEIWQLKNLTDLNLYNNQLTTIPAEIWQLKNLTRLDLSRNQLAAIPAETGQLENLTKLELYGNQLTTIPAEIGQLKNLTYLDLGENQLTAIPAEIGELENLTGFYISNNQLTKLPAEIGELEKLTGLHLSNNQLTAIPAETGQLENLTELYLYDNPLESPPLEIAREGLDAIRNYFRELEEGKGKEVSLYEAKLLIVGEGDVGKSFLRERLIHDRVPVPDSEEDKTTEGIDIEPWDVRTAGVDKFRVNFWDFGGQEIYHATHQFFLTKRSLYVFVWQARKDDDVTIFDYWLNAINLLTDGAPMIVVMNKVDERDKAIQERSIKDKFPNVLGFYKVSAIRGDACDELRERIIAEMGRLDHIGDILPKVWTDIRKKLEGLKKDYIGWGEYVGICSGYGLNEERAEYLASYYHELGVFLHFDDAVLRDIVFLRPDWATNAVYKILDTTEVRDKLGRFNVNQLVEIWKEYPEDKFGQLLGLMEKFELCFKLGESQEYIVPELLAADRPALDWVYDDNFRLEYQYEFMPAGVITRFIARNHEIHKGTLYWRNGVVLTWLGTEAFVESDRINRRIRVWVKGDNKAGLLEIIRREIGHIHETLNNPAVRERLACVCSECVGKTDGYLHDYEKLKRAMAKDKMTVECSDSFEDVKIWELLGKYGLGEDVRRAMEQKKEGRGKGEEHPVIKQKKANNDYDVFLCHNSKDKEAVKKIGEELMSRGILPWLDEWDLRPGMQWQRVMEEQIENIKSAAVFAGDNGTGPWQDMEMEAYIRKFANRKRANDACSVIPVILKECQQEPKLPTFLEGMMRVDFRKSEPDPMERLIWGITGKRPGGGE